MADLGKNNGEIVSPPSPQRSPLSPQAQGERGTQYEQKQQHELKVGGQTRSPSSRCSLRTPYESYADPMQHQHSKHPLSCSSLSLTHARRSLWRLMW